ncbi:hypothetical protein K6U06_22360 [Acidiferrimicrobium sp. IK]|uniref:hypothetical protein n=1 Tax=Acidiferrimicrobium sp. IK TaxID=2871700 RepID=UPI0021CB64F7|nr:hypothetical protein [Acidiferrimicrobium sp. IK]MCU4187122.1 hypothetical protein [Acidiferrimicrobium sp. IK]
MRCDMCGGDAEDLEDVNRVYLLPEPQQLDDVERWCFSCRSQYPHEPAAPA